MITAAQTLANWMLLHLGKGEFAGARMLTESLIRALHSPRIYNGASDFAEFGASHYGLGFQSFSNTTIGARGKE